MGDMLEIIQHQDDIFLPARKEIDQTGQLLAQRLIQVHSILKYNITLELWQLSGETGIQVIEKPGWRIIELVQIDPDRLAIGCPILLNPL
jgi:hypothetical protein